MPQARSQDFSGCYEFGPFRVDVDRRLLLCRDAPVVLAPKAFDLLVALLEAGGRVVPKQELLERVWPGVFVEEANLPQNISLIRKALGDSPSDHRFIVTIPGTGYRFASKVSGVAAAAGAQPGSVAVLPFVNASTEPALDYLCDGLTEGLIANLARIGQLRVKARAVVFRYRDRSGDPQAVGRELGVATVVIGRLVDATIIVELIDVESGWQLWTGAFDAAPGESLRLQEMMARRIAEALDVSLSRDEQTRLMAQVTRSSPAYQCYMKGRYFLNKRLTETLGQALGAFREATDHDPQFGLAYVGLSDTWALQSLYGASRPADVFPQARAAARRALDIDDRLAEAHNSLGVVDLFYGWNFAAAEQAFARAIELNPEYADAHQRYGMLLTATGRFEEAVTALTRAQSLDPLSLINGTIAGYPAYYSGRFAEAEQQFARVLDLDPQFSMAHFRRGLALAQLGRFVEAEEELFISKRLSDDRDVVAALGRIWAMQGRQDQARAAIEELHVRSQSTFVPAYALAVIEAAMGNVDDAFAWMHRAFDERSYWLIYLPVDPALDPLRSDPRFAGLAARLRSEPS